MVILSNYKDPYQPTSSYWIVTKVFFLAHLDLFNSDLYLFVIVNCKLPFGELFPTTCLFTQLGIFLVNQKVVLGEGNQADVMMSSQRPVLVDPVVNIRIGFARVASEFSRYIWSMTTLQSEAHLYKVARYFCQNMVVSKSSIDMYFKVGKTMRFGRNVRSSTHQSAGWRWRQTPWCFRFCLGSGWGVLLVGEGRSTMNPP